MKTTFSVSLVIFYAEINNIDLRETEQQRHKANKRLGFSVENGF